MKAEINPFSPNAGTPPPFLVGRDIILEPAKVSIARLKRGLFAKSLLMTGLRGVGKTVLLNQFSQRAEEAHFHCIQFEATGEKSLGHLLVPSLRRILLGLSRKTSHPQIQKALQVLKSFILCLKISYKDVELSVDPAIGLADSGDVEMDLIDLFVAIGQAAQAHNTAIVIVIDEMQLLAPHDLSALIISLHRMAQKQLPIVLMGAGLPQLMAMVSQSKSYAERLFDYFQLGPLSDDEAATALQQPIKEFKLQFTPAALKKLVQHTQGYPYFVQEWGFQAWNLAQPPRIEVELIQKCSQKALQRLDAGFFRARLGRLTPAEAQYIQALASLGPREQPAKLIAAQLKQSSQQVANTRARLIEKGIVYSPAYGKTAFTVPLFDDFVARNKGQLL